MTIPDSVDALYLYTHIPFCRSRCDYCDFFSRVGASTERTEEVVARIASQLLALERTVETRPILTLYIGGGTPSALDDALTELLAAVTRMLARSRTVHRNAMQPEVTVEVNPEDVTIELLERMAQSGVNRLSVGVQSITDTTLQQIGRHTTRAATQRGVERVARHWNGTWSADLIIAVPGQTEASLHTDLAYITNLQPQHVSLYELTLEPQTRLGLRARRGLLPDLRESHQRVLLNAVDEMLSEAGYAQYEVSNYARPGHQSVHNSAYWAMKPTVGIGPSAVGILPRVGSRDGRSTAVVAERHTNPRSFHRYLASGDYGVVVTPVTARELLEEHLMMGFRRNDGVDPTAIEEIFGLPLTHLIPRTSARWSGYLRTFDVASHGTIKRRIALDREGLLLLDHFLVDVFHELDTTYDGTVPPVRWPLPSTVPDVT